MQLFEQGLEYWQIAKRYHANRETNPHIKPVAVRDMVRLQQRTTSAPVLRRISSFISAHQAKPPGANPPDGGPRYA